MKTYRIVVMGLLCCLMVGCNEENAKTAAIDRRMINTKLVNSFGDIAIENAIISQHTMFPYHFVQNGPELNELGRRDLSILAQHFMEHPGRLNIRKDSVPAALYEARVSFVLEMLKETGIDTERMNISDGMPGGSGIASERVVVILERASKTIPAATSTGRSTGTRTR